MGVPEWSPLLLPVNIYAEICRGYHIFTYVYMNPSGFEEHIIHNIISDQQSSVFFSLTFCRIFTENGLPVKSGIYDAH